MSKIPGVKKSVPVTEVPKTSSPTKRAAAPKTTAAPKKGLLVNENLSGVVDPIAHALQARLKNGSYDTVISEAEARKQKIELVKTPKLSVLKGVELVDLFAPVKPKAESKLARPTTAATKAGPKEVKSMMSPKPARPATAVERPKKLANGDKKRSMISGHPFL